MSKIQRAALVELTKLSRVMCDMITDGKSNSEEYRKAAERFELLQDIIRGKI